MTDARQALIAWKVKKTTEIQDEMAAEGRTSELLWARDCKMLLDHIAAAERRVAEEAGRADNFREQKVNLDVALKDAWQQRAAVERQRDKAAAALEHAVVEASARYCSFSGESIISDANDQAWRDLLHAVEALQLYRRTL